MTLLAFSLLFHLASPDTSRIMFAHEHISFSSADNLVIIQADGNMTFYRDGITYTTATDPDQGGDGLLLDLHYYGPGQFITAITPSDSSIIVGYEEALQWHTNAKVSEIIIRCHEDEIFRKSLPQHQTEYQLNTEELQLVDGEIYYWQVTGKNREATHWQSFIFLEKK